MLVLQAFTSHPSHTGAIPVPAEQESQLLDSVVSLVRERARQGFACAHCCDREGRECRARSGRQRRQTVSWGKRQIAELYWQRCRHEWRDQLGSPALQSLGQTRVWFTLGSKGRKVKTTESQQDTVTEHTEGGSLALGLKSTLTGRHRHPMCSDQQLEPSSNSSALHLPSGKLWERVFYASFVSFLCKRHLLSNK